MTRDRMIAHLLAADVVGPEAERGVLGCCLLDVSKAAVAIKAGVNPRWFYDALRGLDYFRAAGGAPDPRLDEAVEVVRSKQQPDGSWLLENTHPGKVHFPLEDGDGQPSRWNTLRALRVLRWYGGC